MNPEGGQGAADSVHTHRNRQPKSWPDSGVQAQCYEAIQQGYGPASATWQQRTLHRAPELSSAPCSRLGRAALSCPTAEELQGARAEWQREKVVLVAWRLCHQVGVAELATGCELCP